MNSHSNLARMRAPTRRLGRTAACTVVLLSGLSARALAAPLPETNRALSYEKNLELQDLERRRTALNQQELVRRDHLARRLHALYRLANRQPAASTPAVDQLVRLTRRDKSEWAAVVAEQQQVDSEKNQFAAHGPESAPLPPQTATQWPVNGNILRSFGITTVGTGKSSATVYHPAAEISAASGARVACPAKAKIAWRGAIAGHGEGVLLDVGAHYFALLAHLRPGNVSVGQTVAAGSALGTTDRNSLLLALVYQGTPIDPLGWLPTQKRATSPKSAPPKSPPTPLNSPPTQATQVARAP